MESLPPVTVGGQRSVHGSVIGSILEIGSHVAGKAGGIAHGFFLCGLTSLNLRGTPDTVA